MQYIIRQQIRSCEMKLYCVRLDEGEPWMTIGLHGNRNTAYTSQYRNVGYGRYYHNYEKYHTSHVGKN